MELKDFLGSTPLMEAAIGGHIEIVRLLIRHGADVNVRDSLSKKPALMVTRYNHHNEIARLLKKAGASALFL